jgi:hypothetical protein
MKKNDWRNATIIIKKKVKLTSKRNRKLMICLEGSKKTLKTKEKRNRDEQNNK